MTEENAARRTDRRTEIEKRMDSAAEKAVEAYEQNTLLRAAVSAIPVIGGGVDVILTSEAQRTAKVRVFRTLDEMKQRMEQHEEEAINKEYLNSDEFIDLVMKAFDAATKTRDEQKIRWYARILTESTVWRKQGVYFPEEYLHLVADLTPLEVKVARIFYESDAQGSGPKFPDDEAWIAWKEQTCRHLNIDGATLSMNLSRIASTGLIEPVTAGSDTDGFWVHEAEAGDPSFYRATPAFRRLMEFLELDE